MPIIRPAASAFLFPLSGLDDWPPDPYGESAHGGEWLRLLCGLPGGGEVYGGGGGAGPLSNEFPSYLFI